MRNVRKRAAVLLLGLMLCMLTGCGEVPPENLRQDTPAGEETLSALPEETAARAQSATLYFRYGDTGILKQEERELTVLPNESREKALVQALLDGSQSGGSALFPEGTEVLSTKAVDDVIYVTFNEALYGRYPDESAADLDTDDAVLRRRLAMAALCAALTESGEYQSVQVLVRAETDIGSSMRLRESYFLTDSDLPCDPLTRDDAYLPAPALCARQALDAWETRDRDSLTPWICGTQSDSEMLSDSRILLAYEAGEGCVSPDGQSAVVCLRLTLRDANGSGESEIICSLPLRREGGVWKADAGVLAGLMSP